MSRKEGRVKMKRSDPEQIENIKKNPKNENTHRTTKTAGNKWKNWAIDTDHPKLK